MAAAGVHSLSHRERVGVRVGVRGYGLTVDHHPSPDLLRKSTSPQRGEVSEFADKSIQSIAIPLQGFQQSYDLASDRAAVFFGASAPYTKATASPDAMEMPTREPVGQRVIVSWPPDLTNSRSRDESPHSI